MPKIATIAALVSGGVFFYLAANIWFLTLGFRKHWGWGACIFLLGPLGMVIYYLTHLRASLGCTLVMLLGTTMFTCGGIYAYDSFPARDQIYALAHSDIVTKEMPRLIESFAIEAQQQLELVPESDVDPTPPPIITTAVEEPPEKTFRPRSKQVDPATLVGLTIDEIRLKLGKAMGQMKRGRGFVLLYPGMELTSKDGKTINSARRVAK